MKFLTIFAVLFSFSAMAVPKYDRDDWPHWLDFDGDCQNTRHELLIETSETEVTFRSKHKCYVHRGLWYGVYSDADYLKSSQIEIDHVVPLREAHYSGGYAWSQRQRVAFANDTANLLPVAKRANRDKGAKAPDRWRPANEEFWCEYAEIWSGVKKKYGLGFRPEEIEALNEMKDTCQ